MDNGKITEQVNEPTQASARLWHHQYHSKSFMWLIALLAELIILIGIFSLGVRVGLHKANFTYSWINNYPGNFGNRRVMPLRPDNGQFIGGFGVFGTILSQSTNQLVIKDSDGNEKTVILNPATSIRQNFQNLKITDLKTNQQIVVLGAPNSQGQIEAKLIRILN